MYNCYKKDKNGALELIEITDEIKLAFKKNIARAFIKVLPTDNEEGFEINEDNYLKNIDFDDCRYVESEGIIGTVIAKEISGNFVNVDSYFNLENREIEYYLGVEIDEEVHYLKLGTFIVQKPENDNVKDNTSFDALDYMVKFNIEYVYRMSKYLLTEDTELIEGKTYYELNDNGSYGEIKTPVLEDISTYYELYNKYTLLELLQDICNQAGIELGSTNFRNANYIVEGNRFDSGVSCREVLKAIAQMAFSWARINEENKLLLDFNLTNDIDEKITNDEYITLEINNQFGPINIVTLKNSQVEGEHISIRNEASIAENGPTELIILDNPFAYTEEKRRQLIDAASALYGFSYIPLTVKTIGCPYLNCQNKIRVKNMQGDLLDTYIFNNKISYNGAITDIKESKAMTKAETKYQYTGTLQTELKRTELTVDKQNQKIEGVISQVSEQNNKISQVTQTVDELNSKIQDIADITTFGESMYAKVELDGINESEPIQITVKPTVENISYLYPHENLYPSDDLFLKDRKIRFTNKTDNTYIDYVLPDDLLIAPDGTYDEFYLGYDEQVCQVTKRCQYNADGTVSKLDKEEITSYEYPKIELKDGDYAVELLGYTNAYLSVRLMAQNIYTTQFATKVELNSKIEQTATDITSSVSAIYSTKTETSKAKNEAITSANANTDDKLEDYSTTVEMNTKIEQTARDITSTVSSTYATKGELNTAKSEIKQTTDSINLEVGKKVNNEDYTSANILLKLNNDTSETQIKSDKISLVRKRNQFNC